MAAGVAAVVLYDPSARRLDVCPLHRLTGLDCPGCGTTRAVDLVAHGQLLDAFRSNALACLVGVWALGWWVHAVWPAATPWLARWAAPLRARSRPVLVVLLALVAAFTVARNVPGPDAYLAPG